MAFSDVINRVFREFKRYTGDGLPGEPLNAPLPVGDPSSGVHNPKKSEIRAGFGGFVDEVDAAADRAEAAADAAEDALSSIVATSFPTRSSAMSYEPLVAPQFIRLEGYSASGDGGGALYKKVLSAPAHDGKFSLTQADGITVVWYEIVEVELDPMMLGAGGYVGEIEDFKAAIAGVPDDYAAIQDAIDILAARGGGTLRITRFHKSNTPISVPYAISIKGAGRDVCGIFKDSTTTKTVTYYGVAAGSLVTAYPGALPTAANAVLILGGAFVDGRWTGKISGIAIGGTLATPGDYETWKVEFGILSVGAIAYVGIENNGIELVKRAMLIPALWMSALLNNHMWRCQSGLGIENGTSTHIATNYANSCRDYGFAIRALKYSAIEANGVDFLNDPALYDSRTRESTAYVFDSCTNLTVESNGQEQTYGNGMVLDTLRYCCIRFNENIGIGSDYIGTSDIAFIKIAGALVGCEVYGNHGWDVKPTGLTSGGANAAKHHNLFAVGSVPLPGTTFHNNVVRASFSGLDTEAGWGNNTIVERFTAKRAGAIGLGTDPEDSVFMMMRSKGNSSATWAQRLRNSDGTILWGMRDDGVPFAAKVYTETTGGSANMVVGSDGSFVRSTSALKYKEVLGPIPDDVVDKVLAIAGFIYKQKGEEGGREYIGLAADHFHDVGLHWFVQYGAEGEIEGLMYDRIVAVLVQEVRNIRNRIDALER